MNILKKIFKRSNQEQFDNPWNVFINENYFLENAGQVVNCETAMTCPPYASCINLISTSISKLRRHVILNDERVENHKIEKLLKNPNPFLDGYTLIQQAEQSRLNEGNGYILINRDSQGFAKELWLTNPAFVSVMIGEDTYYKVNYNGKIINVDPRDMIHIKTPRIDTSTLKGIGYNQVLRKQIGLWLAAQNYQAMYFANGSSPNGIIKATGLLSTEAKEKIREHWEKKHQGKNKNRIAVLDNGLEYQETSFNFNDLQMKDIFTDITKQVASVFNINPYMIGHDGTSNTYSNIENQNIQYLQQTLMPLIISWEEQFIKLFPKKSPLSVKFNYESLLRADSSSRANRLKTLVDAKIMTIEEARKIEGLQGNGNKKAM